MTVPFRCSDALYKASFVRPVIVLATLFSIVFQAVSAQTRSSQKTPGDRLATTCAQILVMTSTDWVAHSNHQINEQAGKEKKTSTEMTVRALAVYSECYEARTNRLAASLGKSGKGPPMGARENFREFELAVDEFAAKALAATDPPADGVKKAYARLYRKQFRYIFYQSYEPKNSNPIASPANKTAEPAFPPVRAQSTSQPQQDAPVSEMTRAKNRFGELLDALPDDTRREIHKAFGKIFSGGPVSDERKLEVYRFAIFCLEPSSTAPFSSPPF
jgi:hypothetical protein